MSDATGGEAGAAGGAGAAGDPKSPVHPCAHLPSYAQLVGVWAKAVTQMWDIGVEWWKLGVEQSYIEEQRLQVWSTTLRYPRPQDAAVALRCTEFVSAEGEEVSPADVQLTPGEVSPGPGDADVKVAVSRPYRHRSHLYKVTIAEFPVVPGAMGAPPPGQEAIGGRTFRRAFGVPEG